MSSLNFWLEVHEEATAGLVAASTVIGHKNNRFRAMANMQAMVCRARMRRAMDEINHELRIHHGIS